MNRLGLALALCTAACSASVRGAPDANDGGLGGTVDGSADGVDGAAPDGAANPDGGATAGTLSSEYPGDVGMRSDPAVVFAEDFEEGSVAAVQANFSDEYLLNGDRMTLVGDVPAASSGHSAFTMQAVPGAPSAALFKLLPGDYDELYVRYYVKYPAGKAWHHTGVWMGGYADRIDYAYPHAGERPNGDDRISVAVEPVGTANGAIGADPRMDLYMYWMNMRAGGDGMFWGNSAISRKSFTTDDDTWMCIEEHVRLNSDLGSSAGAALDVWKNDVLIRHFDAATPTGTWLWGIFCPAGADSAECTDYAPTDPTVQPLDLQWRKSAALKLNYIWPQNDTQIGESTLAFDDLVVATRRIGCIVPR